MKRQTVLLFPLKSVLFPGTVLQLKVFEARYLDLASQCLREKTPFGVVCLAAGKEAGLGLVRPPRCGPSRASTNRRSDPRIGPRDASGEESC